MKKIVLFSLLLMYSHVFAQQTSLSDIFPLAVDSCWIYYFNNGYGIPAIHIYTEDEGYINYRIDSNEVYSDSIEWHFSAKRDFIRTIYNHTPPVEEHHDTLSFTLIEELEGNHQLHLKENDYLCAFPFFNTAPDSEQFFRYVEIDTSDQLILQLIPSPGYSPFSVTYTLKKDKGILKTAGYMYSSGGWSVHTLFDLVNQIAGIDIIESGIINFNLSQNYPNPFNPSTKISWQTPVSGWLTLKVYDVLGDEVATLVDEYKTAGSYEVEFKSTVGSRQLANGVYFYRLLAGDYAETKKIILLK